MDKFTLDELAGQFCKWHCTKKKTAISELSDEVEVIVNGCSVYESTDNSDEINLCEYCPIDDFLYFVKR